MKETYTVQFKLISEYNLVVQKHIGLVELNKLIHLTEILCAKEEVTAKKNFLIDLRASKFSKDIAKVKDFVFFLRENFPAILTNKLALLADESDQVAMATLFKMYQPGVARNIHIFSSLEYAFLWLNIEMSNSDLEELIRCAKTIEYPEYK